MSVSKRIQLSKQLKLTETQVKINREIFFFKHFKKCINCPDQNLVPKSADKVEAQVHERFRNACPAVLLFPGHLGAKAAIYRRPFMVILFKILYQNEKNESRKFKIGSLIHREITSHLVEAHRPIRRPVCTTPVRLQRSIRSSI